MKHVTIAAIGLLITALPAFAHHPFESEFDAKAPIMLEGKITALEWQDPHVIIKMEAKDDKGAMKTWDLEAASPADMMKMGWTEAMLKTGEQITVHGYKAKAATSSVAAARVIDLPNGKKISSAGNDGGPKT